MVELTLENAVISSRLLLLTQLQALLRRLSRSRLAVLARRERTLGQGALAGIALLTLEEKLSPLSAAETADGSCISCHLFSPFSGDLKYKSFGARALSPERAGKNSPRAGDKIRRVFSSEDGSRCAAQG